MRPDVVLLLVGIGVVTCAVQFIRASLRTRNWTALIRDAGMEPAEYGRALRLDAIMNLAAVAAGAGAALAIAPLIPLSGRLQILATGVVFLSTAVAMTFLIRQFMPFKTSAADLQRFNASLTKAP